MLLSFVFYLNSFGNFALQVTLGSLLSPAEYGRYATVSLAALALAAATLDWLKVSALRFSVPARGDEGVGFSLELGYLAIVVLLYMAAATAYFFQWSFGLTPGLVVLTALLAVGFNRVDFAGARFRAQGRDREFSSLYALRQALYFTIVVGVAYVEREATAVIAAMAFASFACAALAGRGSGAKLHPFNRATRTDLAKLFAYGQPLVVSLTLYQLIYLANRSFALHALGAAAAGNLSLATDVGSRLFVAFNALPELILFQIVLKRMRERGREAAIGQLEINAALAFALLAGLTAGFIGMANTFAALVAPAAYRGSFAGLSVNLAPGFLALCLLISAINPVFQLERRTLPIAIAGGVALIADLALLRFTSVGQTLQGLAGATSASFVLGLAVAIVFAARVSPARPRWRDFGVSGAASVLLGFGLHRLDGLSSHVLAATLALSLGGSFYIGALLVLDVGEIRARMREAFPSRLLWALKLREPFGLASKGVMPVKQTPGRKGENADVE